MEKPVIAGRFNARQCLLNLFICLAFADGKLLPVKPDKLIVYYFHQSFKLGWSIVNSRTITFQYGR